MKNLLAQLLLRLLFGCCTSAKHEVRALSQGQAHVLAERLATGKYGDMFGEAAFRNSRPPQLVSGQWVWHWQRGSGLSDIEIRVTFDRDGSSSLVDYQCM